MIIRNAIGLVMDRGGQSSASTNDDADDGSIAFSPYDWPGAVATSEPILDLPEFERFVFVICVLEHYSIVDCALLLGKTPREVIEVRYRVGDQVRQIDELGNSSQRFASASALACPQRRNKMSTTPYESRRGIWPGGWCAPQRGSQRTRDLEPAISPGLQPLSRARRRGGSSGCGHCEVSDDDLDRRSCNAEISRHLGNCVGGILPLTKKKILRIVRNAGGCGRRTSGHSVASLYALVPPFGGSCKFSTWLTTITE